MDPTGPTGQATTETPAVEARGEPGALVTALKGAGWFSLGLVALVAEGTSWLAKAAVQKGREVAPEAAKTFKTAGTTVEGTLGEMGARIKGVGQVVGKRAEAVEQAIDAKIAAAVERVGAPVLAEMTELKARIDELSQKIETLQTRREKHEKPAH